MLAWGSVLGGLALWEFVGRVLVKNSLFLATPWQTALALVQLWQEGALQHHSRVSGQEFLIGFAIAVVLSIPIGLATAAFQRTAAAVNPWVSCLYATPIIALARVRRLRRPHLAADRGRRAPIGAGGWRLNASGELERRLRV